MGAKRAKRLETIFDRMGISPGRFRIEWISAAEGDKYARVLNEMQAALDAIPESDLLAEIERTRPEMAKRLTRLPNIPGMQKAMEQTEVLVNTMLSKKGVAA